MAPPPKVEKGRVLSFLNYATEHAPRRVVVQKDQFVPPPKEKVSLLQDRQVNQSLVARVGTGRREMILAQVSKLIPCFPEKAKRDIARIIDEDPKMQQV